MSWKTISTTTLFVHPRLTLLEDKVKLPNGATTEYLRFKDFGGGSDIVAMSEDSKILLQREYNHPVGQKLWQFPGGERQFSESHLETAQRELQEESGYHASELKYLGFYYNNRRRTTEVSQVFLATGLTLTNTRHDSEEESLEHVWLSIEEIDELVKSSELVANDALAVWMLFKAHHS
jgi:ADP-ribose pyrophosphatase